MYDKDGDFGKVRVAQSIPNVKDKELFSLNSVGWHRCNEKYVVSRPGGCRHHLIIATVDGHGILKTQDGTFDLTAGTVALIPRDLPNSYQTAKGEEWEFYWIHPEQGLSEQFLDGLRGRVSYVKKTSFCYIPLMEELITGSAGTEVPRYAIDRSLIISEILHHCAGDLVSEPEKTNILSSQTILYIKNHYRENISVDEIARSLYLSPAHLIRTFKKETGMTPHRYLTEYRLSEALQLLKYSSKNVSEIAAEVGFSSASHFISKFKSQYGCTPFRFNW